MEKYQAEQQRLFEEAERAKAAAPKRQQPVGKQRAKKQAQKQPGDSGPKPAISARRVDRPCRRHCRRGILIPAFHPDRSRGPMTTTPDISPRRRRTRRARRRDRRAARAGRRHRRRLPRGAPRHRRHRRRPRAGRAVRPRVRLASRREERGRSRCIVGSRHRAGAAGADPHRGAEPHRPVLTADPGRRRLARHASARARDARRPRDRAPRGGRDAGVASRDVELRAQARARHRGGARLRRRSRTARAPTATPSSAAAD